LGRCSSPWWGAGSRRTGLITCCRSCRPSHSWSPRCCLAESPSTTSPERGPAAGLPDGPRASAGGHHRRAGAPGKPALADDARPHRRGRNGNGEDRGILRRADRRRLQQDRPVHRLWSAPPSCWSVGWSRCSWSSTRQASHWRRSPNHCLRSAATAATRHPSLHRRQPGRMSGRKPPRAGTHGKFQLLGLQSPSLLVMPCGSDRDLLVRPRWWEELAW